MESYASAAEYLAALERRAALPAGFRCSTAAITFTPAERQTPEPLGMNLSLIMLDRPTAEFAGVFTSNRFPGAPVAIGRERLTASSIRGVLVNNKISNVCVEGGREDAEQLLRALGTLTREPAEAFFPSSTGIIGWRLPVAEMSATLPALVRTLQSSSLLPVARAIMTTDRYPKVRSAAIGDGSVVGVAKGAGMIEPRLATMLCFLCTDVSVGREELRSSFGWAVERTLNRLSIDGDQSTSDMALALSSGARGQASPVALREALEEVLSGLADDLVRNGEGASHVIRVRVSGTRDEATAAAAGKAIVNSPLVKTAICGSDPNVGRIASAIGDWAGAAGFPLDPGRVRLAIGGVEIFTAGAFRLDARKEAELSAYLSSCAFDPAARGFPAHDRCVDIAVWLGRGSAEATVLGSDLTAEYVRENADYRS